MQMQQPNNSADCKNRPSDKHEGIPDTVTNETKSVQLPNGSKISKMTTLHSKWARLTIPSSASWTDIPASTRCSSVDNPRINRWMGYAGKKLSEARGASGVPLKLGSECSARQGLTPPHLDKLAEILQQGFSSFDMASALGDANQVGNLAPPWPQSGPLKWCPLKVKKSASDVERLQPEDLIHSSCAATLLKPSNVAIIFIPFPNTKKQNEFSQSFIKVGVPSQIGGRSLLGGNGPSWRLPKAKYACDASYMLHLSMARDPKKPLSYTNTKDPTRPLSATNPSTGVVTEPLITSSLEDWALVLRMIKAQSGGKVTTSFPRNWLRSKLRPYSH